MFSNAPFTILEIMPEPFKYAIETSKQWKMERDRNDPTTSCLSSIFPRNETQDVNFMIQCGHIDAYRLNDIFGLNPQAVSTS